MEDHAEQFKSEAMVMFAMLLKDIEAKDILAKMKKGRRERGGEFDLESIPALSEAKDEVLDFVAYTLFYLLQNEE